jgi:hypothetical protein
MKKVVRLSESDITRIVNKVINEQPEIDRTGDLYGAINSLIDDEYNDVDYEDVANVLENILRGIKAQSHRNKKGMKPISKNDILKNWGLNEQEEPRPFLKKIIAKLKGLTDEQIRYNLKNDLPWDWNGSKEGYYEKMEPRKRHSGSN